MNAQAWAGRGEPDWRALSVAALEVEGAACNLVDTLDSAEVLHEANRVQQAVEILREVRRECDRRLQAAASEPVYAHLRWLPENDALLRDEWGQALRLHKGDAEAAVAHLARHVRRTPVAVAARLVKLGIWN